MRCCATHGIAAADALLGVLGYTRVAKDINEKDAFDKLVASLSTSIAEQVSEIEEKAFSNLVGLADVDWLDMTPANINAVIAAMETAMPTPAAIVPGLMSALGAVLPRILAESREAVALQVGVQLADLDDNAVVQYLRSSEALFITDYLGRRNVALSQRIRAVVAAALNVGASRPFVIAEIERVAGPAAVLGRSASYYDVVAGQFLGAARTYGALTGMRDAGIEQYIFSATLDEVTSDICRALDGSVFYVANALSTFDRLAADPHAAKAINPWVQNGRGPSGERIMYIQDAFGGSKAIGEIVRSGVGVIDDRGEYRMFYTDQQLEAMGVPMPPLHACCRSLVLPYI